MSKSELTLDKDASPEVVAYHLLLRVMEVEGRPLTSNGGGTARNSRNVILDAYSDCLEAVKGKRARKSAAAGGA
jgi:hypothetical protein